MTKAKEKLFKDLDPSSQRRQLVESAEVFRSNWIAFGELLTKIASEKAYKQWGYKRFEDYCLEELRIRKSTAIKLTSAYYFISNEDLSLFDFGDHSFMDEWMN